MAAHAEVAFVVEVDDAAGVGRVLRRAKQGADEDVVAARLEDDGAAVLVVLGLQHRQPLCHAART